MPPVAVPESRRVRVAINREGYFLLFLVLVLGASAIYSGNNGLVLLFAVLVAFFVLGTYRGVQNVKALYVERVLNHEFYANKDHRIGLQIHNVGDNAKFALHFYEDFAKTRHIGPMVVDKLEPGEKILAHYDCVFERRGVVNFRQIVVHSRFPVSFLELRLILPLPATCIVYPHIATEFRDESSFGAQDEASPKRLHSVDERMRLWRKGGSMNRVLWKISAKRQQWIERQIVHQNRSTAYRVQVPPKPKSPFDPDFEQRISEAAALCLHKIAQGYTVSLWQGSVCVLAQAEHQGQRERILKALALI